MSQPTHPKYRQGDLADMHAFSNSIIAVVPSEPVQYTSPSEPLHISHYGEEPLPYSRQEHRNALYNRETPPGITTRAFHDSLGPGLINALQKARQHQWLNTSEVSALITAAIGHLEPQVVFEGTFAWTFSQARDGSFDGNHLTPQFLKKRDRSTSFAVFGAIRATEAGHAPNHWFVMIYDIKQRTLYITDSIDDSTMINAHREVSVAFNRVWESSFNGHPPGPKLAVSIPGIRQNDGWRCGYLCGTHVLLAFYEPKLWEEIVDTTDGKPCDLNKDVWNNSLRYYENYIAVYTKKPVPDFRSQTQSIQPAQPIPQQNQSIPQLITPPTNFQPVKLYLGHYGCLQDLIAKIHSQHNPKYENIPLPSQCPAASRIRIPINTPLYNNHQRTNNKFLKGQPIPLSISKDI